MTFAAFVREDPWLFNTVRHQEFWFRRVLAKRKTTGQSCVTSLNVAVADRHGGRKQPAAALVENAISSEFVWIPLWIYFGMQNICIRCWMVDLRCPTSSYLFCPMPSCQLIVLPSLELYQVKWIGRLTIIDTFQCSSVPSKYCLLLNLYGSMQYKWSSLYCTMKVRWKTSSYKNTLMKLIVLGIYSWSSVRGLDGSRIRLTWYTSVRTNSSPIPEINRHGKRDLPTASPPPAESSICIWKYLLSFQTFDFSTCVLKYTKPAKFKKNIALETI